MNLSANHLQDLYHRVKSANLSCPGGNGGEKVHEVIKAESKRELANMLDAQDKREIRGKVREEKESAVRKR